MPFWVVCCRRSFVDPTRSPKLQLQKLEINPRHPLIHQLNALRTRDPAVATMVAEQIVDHALIAAGLLQDIRSIGASRSHGVFVAFYCQIICLLTR